MPVYTIRDETTDAAAPKTHITVTAPANGRVKLRGLLLGTRDVTGNASVEYELARLTADATGTAQTPNPLDPDAIAARSTALSTITAEGTKGAVLIEIGRQYIASKTFWFPFPAFCQYVNSAVLALIKTVGSPVQTHSLTLFVEE